MESRFNILFFLFTGVMCLSSCERASEDDIIPDVELEPILTSIQSNIFNLNCTFSGCHTGSNPPQGMNLSEGQAFANIVGVASMEFPSLMRINPGNPNQSYLYLKILGDPSVIGVRMPFGRTPLSSEEIEVIQQWIEMGALDN